MHVRHRMHACMRACACQQPCQRTCARPGQLRALKLACCSAACCAQSLLAGGVVVFFLWLYSAATQLHGDPGRLAAARYASPHALAFSGDRSVGVRFW